MQQPNLWWDAFLAEREGDLDSLIGGILPEGYVPTNPLPQVPTRQSAPITGARVPPYSRLRLETPTLRRLLGPAIARVRIHS